MAVTLIVSVLLLYILIGIFLYFIQERVQFAPNGHVVSPTDAGLGMGSEVSISTPDGENLYAWYIPPPCSHSPVVLFLHGTAAKVSTRALLFGHMHRTGFGVLALSYRGYPGSTGKPSEAGLVTDGLAAQDWLESKGHNVVLYGHSLGTGVAVQVATLRSVKAVILEAPFTSIAAVVKDLIPIYPISMITKYPFRSIEYITKTKAPVLVVGAGRDRIVSPKHAIQLYQKAVGPKQLVLMEHSAHNTLWGDGLWAYALNFLAEHGIKRARRTIT